MKHNKLQNLTDYSPADATWDAHRSVSDDVGGVYLLASEFERYASRMASCGGLLRFGWSTLKETGETRLRLRSAEFCRVRHCPICQWRRSLMWQARFYQALPRIVADSPGSRWMFLTLTIRNCAIGELGAVLTDMNAAFKRMEKRKAFRSVQGWIRTTEVTRGNDGSAHPHFHTLMMVPPSMLSGRDYVKQAEWVALWRDVLRVDYDPNVDVRAVKPRRPKDGEALACVTAELVRGAVAETLKYSTKPADMVADPEWFLELTRQTHKRRFVATGGKLKNVLKLDQETDADMVVGDDIADGDDDGTRIAFEWNRPV
ncbi:protein rep, partial [Salmonella enterica]|nr:Replication protein [Salmonella enterica]ECR8762816.1 Replication protein [Salmonella enterica]EDU3680877.1 Replication protein [Salmonella enterica subsp. enterica serovar Baildon]ELU7720759.1 protein rep [Salmonella enterica]